MKFVLRSHFITLLFVMQYEKQFDKKSIDNKTIWNIINSSLVCTNEIK